MYNGMISGLSDLFRLSSAKSRSISPENFTGEPGMGGAAVDGTGAYMARELGRGWKISPSVVIKAGKTFELANISKSGIINHIWMTPTGNFRFSIIRFYWDGSEMPSVECPVGDFFANAYQGFAQLTSIPVCVNPGSAFNCYWQMPLEKCRITMENIDEKDMTLYYQIDYSETELPPDSARFHAQFRRVNPMREKEVYTVLDGVKGKGNYVGTYMAWGVNNNGWWGEGEFKFYFDNDTDYPTICGTGTEDYFCGSYNFDVNNHYTEFCTPYAGLPRVIRPDGLYNSQQRFSMYRWHIFDPIRFERELRVTVQDLGWRRGNTCYACQNSDIASVAYWYQTLPSNPFPPLPCRNELEII